MKLNKVKIIFFDIDGTLLEMGKTEITPNMRKALCSLKQNGIKICIATGRPFVTIPMFEGIVFDAILAFNGSFCVAGDQVVAKCPIPKEDVKKIIFTLFNFIISIPPNQYILYPLRPKEYAYRRTEQQPNCATGWAK